MEIKTKLYFLLPFLFALIAPQVQAQPVSTASLPNKIYSGKQSKFHVQSVAVDKARECLYFSFTDRLIKTDMEGNLLGSVTGIVGHLGDMVYDAKSDKIYASLEYKNDAIGKGITQKLGIEGNQQDGFYIAVFDASRINDTDLSAEDDKLLKTVYLKEVVDDYLATVTNNGKEYKHRFACSGIDGITLAPPIGKPNSKKRYLYVAYGVYGDTTRTDNDHQVILKYDIAKWDKMGRTLYQNELHQSGPKKPKSKYFVMTGNTTYGIQNLAYDAHSGNLYAAVYKGKKSKYPNYSLFVIDGSAKPKKKYIVSDDKRIKVKTLSLLDAGLHDEATGIRGWNFKWGATGMCPIGNGLFYFSHNKKHDDGMQSSTLYKYQWTGDKDEPFTLME